MEWPWEIVERDHDIQNPMSAEKIRLLGEYLRLDRQSHVLDVACGKAGPALVLAASFGCRIRGVELRPGFADEARARIAANALTSLITVETADASKLSFGSESVDAALCLGASFVWGHVGDAAVALLPAVKAGGFVAVGEPYWRRWPLPVEIDDDDFVSLEATIHRLEATGVRLTGVIAASDDDWDHYESLHWRAIEEWLAEHPDEPGADDIRAQHARHRDDYVRFKRALLGWAIFVGRKP